MTVAVRCACTAVFVILRDLFHAPAAGAESVLSTIVQLYYRRRREAAAKDPEIMKTLRETAFVADAELIAPMMWWRYNGQPTDQNMKVARSDSTQTSFLVGFSAGSKMNCTEGVSSNPPKNVHVQ